MLDSSTLMQLEAFHTMWELYHEELRGNRLPPAATRMKRDTLDSAHALSEFPVGTAV